MKITIERTATDSSATKTEHEVHDLYADSIVTQVEYLAGVSAEMFAVEAEAKRNGEGKEQ